jgi:hypothetical protein
LAGRYGWPLKRYGLAAIEPVQHRKHGKDDHARKQRVRQAGRQGWDRFFSSFHGRPFAIAEKFPTQDG